MTQRDPEPTGLQPSGSPTETYTPQPAEATDTPAATTRVDTTRPARPGAGRWAIALGIVAVAVGVAAAAAFMLTGKAATSVLVGYTPADSVMYMEVRLDLPGDQRAKVGEFLSTFPGFDDQSTLETKIAEALDRLISEGTAGAHDYSTEIKPWFSGEVGLALIEMPEPAAAASMGRFLALATVTDGAAAGAWFKDIAGNAGGTTETYAGTELTIFPGPIESAFAIGGGKVMLLGDVASVKASLDTGGNSGFGTSEQMTAARGGIKGDHLGFMFMDMAAYFDWAMESAESMGGMAELGFDESIRELLPDWMAGALRAENDGLAMDMVMPHVASSVLTENRRGAVAEHLPPSTIFVADIHELGKSIDQSIELYRSMPAYADAFKEIDAAMGILGGFDATTGWLGETGIAVARTDDGVHGGLVTVPTDHAAAERLLTTLRSFATIGGSQAGITVRDETYQGSTITIVDLGDLSQLAGGGDMSMIPFTGHAELAYALTDDALIVGVGPGFVRAALDAGPGPSLAEDARYRGLLDRVGTQNAAVMFLDLAAVRDMLEQLASTTGADLATYERDIKPYLLPFDAIVSATVVGGELDQSRMLITVK
jgi:hypothetical protein